MIKNFLFNLIRKPVFIGGLIAIAFCFIFFFYLKQENMKTTKNDVSRFVSRWKYKLGENIHYGKDQKFIDTFIDQLVEEYPITEYRMYKNEQLISSWPKQLDSNACEHKVSHLLTLRGIHIGKLNACVSEAYVKKVTIQSPMFIIVCGVVGFLIISSAVFSLLGYKTSLIHLARAVREWTEGKEKSFKLFANDKATNEILEMVQEGVDSRVQNSEFKGVIENQKSKVAVSNRIVHDLRSPIESMATIEPELKKVCSPLVFDIFKGALNRVHGVVNLANDRSSDYFKDEIELQNINQVVENIIEEKKGLLKNIDFSIDMPNSFKALFEPNKLSRVLSNIIKNAAESYENRTGKIILTVEADDTFTVIKVKDFGKGISKKHLKFIFKDNFTYGKESGKGIGLSTAKIWLENWGGFIHIESEENQGTEVKLVLKNKTESKQKINNYSEATV